MIPINYLASKLKLIFASLRTGGRASSSYCSICMLRFFGFLPLLLFFDKHFTLCGQKPAAGKMLEIQCQIATQTMIMYFLRTLEYFSFVRWSISMKHFSNVMREKRRQPMWDKQKKRIIGTISRRWKRRNGRKRWRRRRYILVKEMCTVTVMTDQLKMYSYLFTSSRRSHVVHDVSHHTAFLPVRCLGLAARGSKSFFLRRSLTVHFEMIESLMNVHIVF